MPADAPHPGADSPEPASNLQSTHAVVLLHTLPDGTSHFDWLIEIPNRSDEHRLRAFRTDSDPSLRHSGQLFHGEQLPDHRAHYLSYEGPISGDRGSVLQVACGVCDVYDAAKISQLQIQIHWGPDDKSNAKKLRYCGKNIQEQAWEFGCD